MVIESQMDPRVKGTTSRWWFDPAEAESPMVRLVVTFGRQIAKLAGQLAI